MPTTARLNSMTRPQKFVATIVLPVLILFVAAALGSLIGGSAAPAPASATTVADEVGACPAICGTISGAGGSATLPEVGGEGMVGGTLTSTGGSDR